MSSKRNGLPDTSQLAMVLEKVPAGITVIDQEVHILYYNEYCTRFVDRKPEYIGKNIRFCHQQATSIEKIEKNLSDLKEGRINEFYYESERNGKKLGVRVTPFAIDGKDFGFILRFSVI
jgi:DUF438 domain-containing protein